MWKVEGWCGHCFSNSLSFCDRNDSIFILIVGYVKLVTAAGYYCLTGGYCDAADACELDWVVNVVIYNVGAMVKNNFWGTLKNNADIFVPL
jgi:hypothetical protein